MATPKYVKTTISKDGKKLRDEYDDGSSKNVRPNPEYKEVKAETKGKKIIDATQGKSKSSKDDSHNPASEKYKSQDKTIRVKDSDLDEEGNAPIIIRPYYGSDNPTAYTPEDWQEFAKSTGFKTKSRSIGQQNEDFQNYLAKHPDWKDKIEALHKQYGPPKEGKYDSMIGRRWDALYKKPEPKTPVEKTKINPAPEEQAVTKDPWVRENLPIPSRKVARAPWWLQDIVKTAGAAGDFMRINRHLPYQQRPEMYLPEGTYYDPTRELAANAEQANIQTQGMGAFAGPQALSARSSSIQGQALKNAADIEARYNNLNVGISNQLSQERTNIRNQQAQNVAGLNTQLWDKYTIANQQFDNSRNMARQNLRQSYIDAITNRAKAQALNSMFPNNNTNPGQGGMIDFIGSNDMINANKLNNTNEYWDAVALTGSRKDALDYLKMMKGMKSSSNPYDQDINYAQQQQYPSQG